MLEKIWKRLVNQETVSYVIFGVLTTFADWGSYWVMRQYGVDYRIATAGAWAAAVLFAFVTNKLFVFHSYSLCPGRVWAEFVPFVICRAATGAFTIAAMILMVDGLKIKQDFVCKVAVSVVSLVLNYLFSKWVIFKKRG